MTSILKLKGNNCDMDILSLEVLKYIMLHGLEKDVVNLDSRRIEAYCNNIKDPDFPTIPEEITSSFWTALAKVYENRDLLEEVKQSGKCKCITDPFPFVTGMEGIVHGESYRYERVIFPNERKLYRIFHDFDVHSYYETCSDTEFKRHFEIEEIKYKSN